MSTWEERMAVNHHARVKREVDARRRAYLGEVFLEFYPPDEGAQFGFEPLVDIDPQIIAARCLGIAYGDPGPQLPEGTCRECYGERHVWLGNTWGLRHTEPRKFPAPGHLFGCGHTCHEGEVWMAGSTIAGSGSPEVITSA